MPAKLTRGFCSLSIGVACFRRNKGGRDRKGSFFTLPQRYFRLSVFHAQVLALAYRYALEICFVGLPIAWIVTTSIAQSFARSLRLLSPCRVICDHRTSPELTV